MHQIQDFRQQASEIKLEFAVLPIHPHDLAIANFTTCYREKSEGENNHYFQKGRLTETGPVCYSLINWW